MKASRPGPLAIFRWLLDLAILGLVAVVLLAVVLGRLVPLLGAQTLIIGGPSMEPTLPLGSAVVIRPVAPEAIAVGDIVSIRSGAETSIFTHRVSRLLSLEGEPFLETKGDNNPAPDGATVPASAVIGRVDWTVPLMGYVIALLSVPSGVAFVLGLGAILILVALLADSADDERRRRRAPTSGTATVGAPPKPALAVDASGSSAASLAALVRPRSRRPELGTETSRAASGAVGSSRPRQGRRARTTRPAA